MAHANFSKALNCFEDLESQYGFHTRIDEWQFFEAFF